MGAALTVAVAVMAGFIAIFHRSVMQIATVNLLTALGLLVASAWMGFRLGEDRSASSGPMGTGVQVGIDAL
jgi:hypothetical protein